MVFFPPSLDQASHRLLLLLCVLLLVPMTTPFRGGASRLLLRVCRRRGSTVALAAERNDSPGPLALLLAETNTIKGVGPSSAASLQRLGINTVLDLLFHMPTGVHDW
jgi:hypothetical protein